MEHLQQGEARWVILDMDGKLGRTGTIPMGIIDNLAPHDLRHTFAKRAHKAGAPIEQI